MNTPENGRAGHPILWTLTVLVAVAVAFAGYLVFAPGPTAFAQGKRVALADYHDTDPTGVPDELKSASLMERGEYLTRAADCVVCHTVKGGSPSPAGVPSCCRSARCIPPTSPRMPTRASAPTPMPTF